MAQKYKHLFGPVPSRRFGRSLGIDLTPFKTCSYDCIFCQLGRTTVLTKERKEYITTKEIISEIDAWLEKDGQADVITMAGSGEPTLHTGIGKIITHIKAHCSIPVAVLTNGSMLHDSEVRTAISKADIVKISLSAYDDDSLQKMNRPTNITFAELFSGEKEFRKEFKNQLWMEIFLAEGINTEPDQIKKLAKLASEISPDKIQLNTSVRPPAESFVKAVSREKLLEFAQLFQPKAEVIAESAVAKNPDFKADEEAVYEMLLRRPCTSRQIAEVFGMHLNEVSKYVGKLVRDNKIKPIEQNNETYYSGQMN